MKSTQNDAVKGKLRFRRSSLLGRQQQSVPARNRLNTIESRKGVKSAMGKSIRNVHVYRDVSWL